MCAQFLETIHISILVLFLALQGALQLPFYFFFYSFSSPFLNRLTKVIFKVFYNSYRNDVPCAFKPYPLEIKGKGGLKEGHLGSCPSTTKTIISPLWPPN